MNFDQNDKIKNNRNLNRNELLNDDLNIKSHLNNSLEDNGIQVSEDLINRTLAAIQRSEEENALKNTSVVKKQKAFTWGRYSRHIAGVAAAVFVVVAGYSALRIMSNTGFNAKNNANENYSGQELNGYTAKDQDKQLPRAENSVLSDTTQKSTEFTAGAPNNDVSIASDAGSQEGDITYNGIDANKNADRTEATTEAVEGQGNVAMGIAPTVQQILSFYEVFPLPVENLEYIHITNQTLNQTVSLNPEERYDFYNSMSNHFFETNTLKEIGQYYTIEVKGTNPNGVIYTILLGEKAEKLTPEEKEETEAFEPTRNMEETRIILDQLFNKYSNN